MNTANEVDWYKIGCAERELIRAVVKFENDMLRIDQTTYTEDNRRRYSDEAVTVLREAIHQYGDAVRSELDKIDRLRH